MFMSNLETQASVALVASADLITNVGFIRRWSYFRCLKIGLRCFCPFADEATRLVIYLVNEFEK